MPDLSAVKAALTAQKIETPSWAYGNSGTRFIGLDPDPIAADRRFGRQQRIAAERVGGAQAGWGA